MGFHILVDKDSQPTALARLLTAIPSSGIDMRQLDDKIGGGVVVQETPEQHAVRYALRTLQSLRLIRQEDGFADDATTARVFRLTSNGLCVRASIQSALDALARGAQSAASWGMLRIDVPRNGDVVIVESAMMVAK